MQTQVLRVPGVSCEHCRRAITESVGKLGGIRSVEVDLAAKRVTVAFDPGRTTLKAIREAIEEAGYDVEE
ncbi:MAG: heavy-metal-associated domain-containing protein [Limnochordaceae bacterium]|nr:heavy-metal-associated domain-containing protein [Limnochordaceae bacterium]